MTPIQSPRKQPFDREPGWVVTSINLNVAALLERATSIDQTVDRPREDASEA